MKSLRCAFGFHDVPIFVDRPGRYPCKRCGTRVHLIDWQNIKVHRNGAIERTNLDEVVMRYLEEEKRASANAADVK